MKLSITTLLGYIQLAFAVAICAKPIYDYWTITNYNAVAEAAGSAVTMTGVTALLAAIRGHFTADAPQDSPK